MLGDAVFYLMEPVDGFNAGSGLPALHAGDAGIRHEMGLSMADAVAWLAPSTTRGRPRRLRQKTDGFLDRQVPRWLSGWSPTAVSRPPGPDIGDAGGGEMAAAEPARKRGPRDHARRLPRRERDVLPTGPEVVAIVDWEMCTIGDPLLDLGWMLATWYDPATTRC